MQSISWPTTAAVVSALGIPVVFDGILYVWSIIDESLGRREVSLHIRDHQSIITQRLKNPKVHFLSLTHLPSQPEPLLIQFDVDDQATYEMLESDLNDTWVMRFPPQWETNLRSKERISKSYGYAAWDIAKLGEGITRMMIAGIVSLAPVTCFAFLALCHAHCSRPAHPMVTATTEL